MYDYLQRKGHFQLLRTNSLFLEKSRKPLCCRGWRTGKIPHQTSPAPFLSLPLYPHSPPKAPVFLLSSPQGPYLSSPEMSLIWACYKNNNNPNAEKPQKELRATLPPPSPPTSLPIPNRVQNRTQSRHSVQGGGGLGSKQEGWPWGHSVQVHVGDGPNSPHGAPWGLRRWWAP